MYTAILFDGTSRALSLSLSLSLISLKVRYSEELTRLTLNPSFCIDLFYFAGASKNCLFFSFFFVCVLVCLLLFRSNHESNPRACLVSVFAYSDSFRSFFLFSALLAFIRCGGAFSLIVLLQICNEASSLRRSRIFLHFLSFLWIIKKLLRWNLLAFCSWSDSNDLSESFALLFVCFSESPQVSSVSLRAS